MAPPHVLRALPVLLVLLAACAPWRSDIDLPPGVAAAPVLEVSGWQRPLRRTGPRQLTFGPWHAERRTVRETWLVELRRDTAVVGTAACQSDANLTAVRSKGRMREVPDEDVSCDLLVPGATDTVRLEMKADVGRPFTGRAQSEDWEFAVRGTGRLRTRGCLYFATCGWYVTLDGMDIAAIEADARAWVFLSPDLGGELRDLAALLAAAVLLRADPGQPTPGPQRAMMSEP